MVRIRRRYDALVRIAFATTTADVLKGEDVDRGLHDAAFAAAGVALDHCVWWDQDIAWQEYDLVVIRSPWDYVERLPEFRRWLHRVGALGNLRNPAPVVEWNLDKRYLRDVEAEGVPIVPTEFILSRAEFVQAMTSRDGEVVVKPAVSAGSRNTGRFASDDPHAVALAERIVAEGVAVMIQPCVASVETSGETSVVFFNGVMSHAFRKGAILASGGGYLGGDYTEDIGPAVLTDQQEQVAHQAVDILARITRRRFGIHSPLLYGRVDLVTLDDGGVVVLETELAEPSFFLAVDSEAPSRFLAAVEEHVVMATRE